MAELMGLAMFAWTVGFIVGWACHKAFILGERRDDEQR